ncbi:hypothetical protein [Capnocytophaga sp.]|uniref:hypothetical protein n=1 Tax=Capnocytophaga sp. TaxID=44737 RepID=UPI0026DB0780|nr:hypothetical protein [Capnocytophaga sp.]MDO5105533.1 hypothetical protein [Capnocytophaga sp.]
MILNRKVAQTCGQLFLCCKIKSLCKFYLYAIKTIKVAKNQQVEFFKQELKEATQAEFEKAILEVK